MTKEPLPRAKRLPMLYPRLGVGEQTSPSSEVKVDGPDSRD